MHAILNGMLRLITRFTGHSAELSNCLWNFDESMIGTSSIDATARLWDMRYPSIAHIIDGHSDEVLDICFNYTGKLFATASNDCTCKIWDAKSNFELISTMTGHTDEVSKVRICHSSHQVLIQMNRNAFTILYCIGHI